MAISGILDSISTNGGAGRDAAAEQLLARAERNLRAARRAGHERLVVGAEWARLHVHEPSHAHPLDHWTEIGATGLRIYEYAAAELAVSLQIHPLAAHRLMGDAIDLQTRLPLTWAAVAEFRVEDWVARKIVSKTRDLPDDLARQVDAEIADHLGVLPPGRLFAIVEARVVAADTELAEKKAAEARNAHGVWPTTGPQDLGATDTAGLFIRGNVADVKRFYESVDNIAHRLADEATTESDAETMDQLRARAVGILADPHGAVEFLAGRNPARGRTTLDQLTTGTGVARVEDLGPFTRTQLIGLLGHERITVRPVIDLADRIPADAYEIPDAMAERLHLTKPADVFPHAVSLSRRLDHDHTIPYQPGGPPGQTRIDNLGKLSRRHHRVKTHAGWTIAQLPGDRYLWVTPHGRCRITDSAGTHVVTDEARVSTGSTIGSRLELYLTDLVLAA
jgi:hypothetical protein